MDSKKVFEEYFNNYYQKAYYYVLKKVGNHHVAEDIVMDSFSSCWKKFDVFDPERASFSTWLFVIICNRLKNYYRSINKTEDISCNFPDNVFIEDDIIAAQQLMYYRNILAEALKTLNEQQRNIIVLYYFKGKTTKEIGSIMNISHVNTRVCLSRAIVKIREYFKVNGCDI